MKLKILQTVLVIALGTGAFFVGNNIYRYFTHDKKPHLMIEGLAYEQYCKGELSCSIVSNNDYKIANVQAFLDEQPLTLSSDGSLSTKQVKLPLLIDTTALADGKHTLRVEATDSSYHHNNKKQSWDFYVDNVPLKGAFLDESYNVHQGKTLHLKIKSNKALKSAQIKLGESSYQAYPESPTSNIYECFVPIECEARPGEELLVAELEDDASNVASVKSKATIQKFKFKRQTRSYDIQKKLDEERDVSANDKILQTAINKWGEKSPSQKLWSGAFEIPTQMQILLTPHGEIRVTPERGRYMHQGIDIANLPRSVVWAAQDGKIVIKERFLLTGNTIVIDHGRGVSTVYAHLEDFTDIEVGDLVKKGNPVGRLGKTGYTQGYHLHWELRVNGVAVDPLEWTKTVY